MPTFLPNSPLSLTILTIFTLNFIVALSAKHHGYVRTVSPMDLGLKKEKLTYFRVYWHDVVAGKNPTAIRVASAPSTNMSATGFGAVIMIDDALTEGPTLGSRLIGRAQGLYAFAGQAELSALMAMNFAFVTGKYNGSTISIMGRNAVLSKVREMSIVGGSGLFRLARGYVQARTYNFDLKSGDATVEYNVFVMHY